MTYQDYKAKLKKAQTIDSAGKLEESIELCKEILYEVETSQLAPDQKVEAGIATRLHICNVFRKRGQYEDALTLAMEILAMCIEHNNRIYEAKLIHTIANIYRFMQDTDKSLEYLNRAIQIYEEFDCKQDIADAYGHIGDSYTMKQEFAVGLEYSQRAIALHEELGNKRGVAFIMINIGQTYQRLNNHPLALEYLMKALAIHEELGYKVEQAQAMSNIGIVYYCISDFPRALEFMGRARDMFESFGMERDAMNVVNNIGNVYCTMKDYRQALEYMSRSLTFARESGEIKAIAYCTYSIGVAYREIGDYPRALVSLGESLEHFESLQFKSDIATIKCAIGAIYADPTFPEYNPIKAEVLLVDSLAQIEAIGSIGHNISDIEKLAELYEHTEQWEHAKNTYKKIVKIEREASSGEVKKQADKFAFDRKIAEEQAHRQATEALLHNILPKSIADRKIQSNDVISDYFENVSIFFSDIVDFTQISMQISPQALIEGLNSIFSEFDRIAKKHGLEKIKTIGDAYMAVCGAPEPNENHAHQTALFALEILEAINNYTFANNQPVRIRIGLHCGSVVAGVIGENKFAYDLWGDAVNTASRMEAHGEPGKIHISEDFKNEVDREGSPSPASLTPKIIFTDRGEIEIKGKGTMKTYFLEKV